MKNIPSDKLNLHVAYKHRLTKPIAKSKKPDIKCPICKETVSFGTFALHLTQQHPNRFEKNAPRPKLVHCSMCNKNFPWGTLTKHIQKDHDWKRTAGYRRKQYVWGVGKLKFEYY